MPELREKLQEGAREKDPFKRKLPLNKEVEMQSGWVDFERREPLFGEKVKTLPVITILEELQGRGVVP